MARFSDDAVRSADDLAHLGKGRRALGESLGPAEGLSGALDVADLASLSLGEDSYEYDELPSQSEGEVKVKSFLASVQKIQVAGLHQRLGPPAERAAAILYRRWTQQSASLDSFLNSFKFSTGADLGVTIGAELSEDRQTVLIKLTQSRGSYVVSLPVATLKKGDLKDGPDLGQRLIDHRRAVIGCRAGVLAAHRWSKVEIRRANSKPAPLTQEK